MSDYLTTVRGTLMAGTVGEQFQHSLAVQSNAEPSAVAGAVATAWADAWSDPLGAIAHHFPSGVLYTESTAAIIMDPVQGTLSAAYHQPMTAGAAGTNPSGAIPTQNAIAVSLYAGQRPNGAPIKGRFYLPVPARDTVDTASGLLNPLVQSEIAANMWGFIGALDIMGHTPCVWSRVLGNLTPVQSIRVGNRVDTIRRRRNSAGETYVTPA